MEPSDNVSHDRKIGIGTAIKSRSVQRPSHPSSSALVYAAGYNSSGARLRQVRGAPVGMYRRERSRFWWISYTVDGVQKFESTKTTSKELAKKIWKKREGEIALGLFKVGWPGERMTFAQLAEEFRRSHTSTLSVKSQRNHQLFIKNLQTFWGERRLTEINQRMVEEYRDY